MSTLFNKQIRCPFCELKFPSRTNYVNKKFEEISSHQDAVEKFMKLGGQEVPLKPLVPSVETRKLRANLIFEEAMETINALGFEITYDFDLKQQDSWVNLKEIVDGCCDLRVVTTGTLSACGVKDIRPQELVDDNNLQKFKWTTKEVEDICDENIWITQISTEYTLVKNKDGKIIKPPSHVKVNLEAELERQLKLNL